MIIDIHTHTFPPLGSMCGEDPPELQMRFLQHHLYFHHQGWYCEQTKQITLEPSLYDSDKPGINGMRDVDFRVGGFGRLMYTDNGENFWIQWLPPSFRELECTPELLLANMDYVGIDFAVLCPTHIYGELNEYTSNCVRSYPYRFVGIAAIREWRGFEGDEIARLTRAVEEMGLIGLHFATEAFFMVDYLEDWSSKRFDPLWKEVERLNIPVFWDIFSWGNDPWAQWKLEAKRLSDWANRFSQIPSLITHGLPILRWEHSADHVVIPDFIWELYRRPNIYVEVMLPGQLGQEYEYPYPIAKTILYELHQELGPHKLVWGSDLPTIERMVTYRQSLEYLKYCDFLNEEDYGLLTGGNAKRLLKLS
ncbi:MAG: amidohydrolase family protein [Anaerolineales bacterium]|nr:amidohydrolase family protein [Anaerolineales bacterium]